MKTVVKVKDFIICWFKNIMLVENVLKLAKNYLMPCKI